MIEPHHRFLALDELPFDVAAEVLMTDMAFVECMERIGIRDGMLDILHATAGKLLGQLRNGQYEGN